KYCFATLVSRTLHKIVMVARHIALTLIPVAALALIIRKHQIPAWTLMQTAGLCLLLVGFVLWTVARFQLGASFAVKAQAKHLVTHGLYARFRNPIYIFGSVTIAGFL